MARALPKDVRAMAHNHCLSNMDNGRKQMKSIRSLITVIAFSFAVMALPAMASAQWQSRNDGYWSGNNGRNANIRGTVQSLQNQARAFDRQVSRVDDRRDDRAVYRTGRDRNDRFDGLDRLATQFKNAAQSLANEYDNGRNMNKSRDEAQRVLSIGSQIDQMMSSMRNRMGNRADLEAQWRQIDSNLQTIARAYGLNYQSRNGRWER
jgi:uncharacterized phage infection (PIP) family protein YhgE